MPLEGRPGAHAGTPPPEPGQPTKPPPVAPGVGATPPPAPAAGACHRRLGRRRWSCRRHRPPHGAARRAGESAGGPARRALVWRETGHPGERPGRAAAGRGRRHAAEQAVPQGGVGEAARPDEGAVCRPDHQWAPHAGPELGCARRDHPDQGHARRGGSLGPWQRPDPAG